MLLDLLIVLIYAYFTYHIKSIFIFSVDYYDLLTNIVTLQLHTLNATSFWVYGFSIGNTNVFFLISSMIYIKMLFTKIKQVTPTIYTQETPLTERKLNYFRYHYTTTLVYFFAGNRHFGCLFLALLLAHCPSNVFMVVAFLHGRVPPNGHLFIGTFMFYQFFNIFGMHLLFASAIKVIYKPRRFLCNLMATGTGKNYSKKFGSRVVNSRKQLSLSLIIHSFPSDKHNQISFTYGPFGQVTMGAFTKYVLLYVKFLLITHKWIRTN